MKKNVLLIDAFSTLHVGNGALLENTYKLVRKNTSGEILILSIDPETNVGHFPNVLKDIFKEYTGNTLKKLGFSISLALFLFVEIINTVAFTGRIRFPWARSKRDLIESIDNSEVCVSLSGETINDHYYAHMYQRVLIYWLAILKKKDFVIFPQSIGPVFRPFSRHLLRLTLGNSRFIVARDQQSFETAKLLWEGKKVKILFCPDVAVTQDSVKMEFAGKKTNRRLVGLTVSEAPKAEMNIEEDYLFKLLRAVQTIFSSEEYEILLMPSNYAHGGLSKDYLACLRAKKYLDDAGYATGILDNRLYYPPEFQGIQKSLYAFISTRMHVGILATSAAVPTFMINTQHKILSYMENIDMAEYVGEVGDREEIWVLKLRNLCNLNDQIRSKLQISNKELRNSVDLAVIKIFQEIE